MTESMNLDSADIVGSLEGFDTGLDTSYETEYDMLNHEDQIQLGLATDSLSKDETQMQEEIIKEEIVENMEEEITEEQLMEETITYDDVNITSHVIGSVMDIVEDGTSYNEDDHLTVEHETSEIQNDNEIFSDRVIGEEIVSGEQTIQSEPHIYEDTESEKEFQDINEIMQDNIVNEETVIDGPEIMESEVQQIEPERKYDSIMSPDVYIVQPHGGTVTHQPIIQTNAVIAPKEPKMTKVVVPAADTGQPQTIRIVAPHGKFAGSAPKTITFAQAKQMGLLNFNHIIQPSVKGGIGKLVVPKKTVTVMKPTNQPTKILPAPPARSQKVVIRGAGGSLKSGTLLTGTTPTSVIRIPASQAAQLQLPSSNKQVQFVKIVGNNKTGAATILPVQTLSTKSIPVALQSLSLNSPQAFKVLPFTTTQAASGQPQTTAVTGTQRVLIPASTTQVVSSTVVQPTQQAPKHGIVMFQPQLISQVKEAHSFEETAKSSSEAENILTQDKVVPTVSAVKATTNGKKAATPTLKIKEEVIMKTELKSDSEIDVVEANGIRPRKPCNCTKSMCLKLYCDCFANGEFCHQCNCTTCYNNLSHEEERQRAIKSCLERNPTAFRPKIGKTYVGSEERRHNKGCNCRRSGCLKNYCECYEAKIPCSKNCKCIGCKNTEGLLKRGLTCEDIDKLAFREKPDSSSVVRSTFEVNNIPGHRQVLNLMSPQLVEATCQCLVAQVEEWSRSDSTDLDLAQALVIEELGRCLAQLIECINKSLSQIPQSAS